MATLCPVKDSAPAVAFSVNESIILVPDRPFRPKAPPLPPPLPRADASRALANGPSADSQQQPAQHPAGTDGDVAVTATLAHIILELGANLPHQKRAFRAGLEERSSPDKRIRRADVVRRWALQLPHLALAPDLVGVDVPWDSEEVNFSFAGGGGGDGIGYEDDDSEDETDSDDDDEDEDEDEDEDDDNEEEEEDEDEDEDEADEGGEDDEDEGDEDENDDDDHGHGPHSDCCLGPDTTKPRPLHTSPAPITSGDTAAGPRCGQRP